MPPVDRLILVELVKRHESGTIVLPCFPVHERGSWHAQWLDRRYRGLYTEVTIEAHYAVGPPRDFPRKASDHPRCDGGQFKLGGIGLPAVLTDRALRRR